MKLLILAVVGLAVYGLMLDLLMRCFDHARPRARVPRSQSPDPPSRVQGAHPGIEVGRPATPGAAPPGGPMHSDTRTRRAEHIFRLR